MHSMQLFFGYVLIYLTIHTPGPPPQIRKVSQTSITPSFTILVVYLKDVTTLVMTCKYELHTTTNVTFFSIGLYLIRSIWYKPS
jgi:hypothetical protein